MKVEKIKKIKKVASSTDWLSRALFLVGFLLLCYPLVSGFIQRQNQKDAVATYEQGVSVESEDSVQEKLELAKEYNNVLFQTQGAIIDGYSTDVLSDDNYNSLLNQSDTGVMGSIEIPKIDVDLPIYHGTSDEVLSSGVGHQQGSSLPIGGENTRCILTGHRGLPGSKLFTRLDEMVEGDLFFLKVMGETMAYKVTKIEVIEPDDASIFEITSGKDECSLVTCTPYGLNTHRLVVTGERVPYEKTEYQNISKELPSFRELLFTALPFVVFIGAIIIKFVGWRKSRYEKKKFKN